MKHFALIALGAAILLLAAGSGEARAQLDLNAGKSGAQLFASNCAACHRSPGGLARGRDPRRIAGFLLQHYTARPQHAGAIANYLVSVRRSAPPRRAINRDAPSSTEKPSTERRSSAPVQTTTAAPTPTPPARQAPLDKIANATVERLKSFATAADPAVPSDPDTPPRGVERIRAYATTGTPPGALRQTAVSAALREARTHPQSLRRRPSDDAGAADSGKSAEGAKPTDGTTATIAPPAAAEGQAVSPPPQLQGPPASGARPSRQSNDDQL